MESPSRRGASRIVSPNVSEGSGAVEGESDAVEHQGSLVIVNVDAGSRDDDGPLRHEGPEQGTSRLGNGGTAVPSSRISRASISGISWPLAVRP
jgi:hypothetical protein